MTTDLSAPTPAASRWLHRWAVLTVCAAAPLLLLGAEVTTKKVGMVDPVGFRAPWHLLTVSLEERGLGYLIEHSHRVAGFVVGTCTIVLALWLWLAQRRRWLGWLGVAALAGVGFQGVLGILRVNRNAQVGPELALVHGLFAQLVFALLVSVAVLTSPYKPGARATGSLRRWSLITAALVYLQIVFGAFVRHTDNPYAPRLHLLAAFAVVAAVVWLVKEARGQRPALLLAFLVALQIVFGVEAWLSKFASPELYTLRPLSVQPGLFRSLHYVVGSLVFATAVVVALQAHRRTVPVAEQRVAPLGRLEGAA